MIATTEQLAPTLGLATACDILQVPRSSVYRARQPNPAPRPTAEPVRALSEAERDGRPSHAQQRTLCRSSPARGIRDVTG